jgi:hypothetical protein
MIVVACTLMACSGGGEAGIEVPASPPTTPAVLPSIPSTTASSTIPPTTTLPVTTGIVLPPDLGRLVASAPGVSTPGDIWELAPKLWLFLPSESVGDPNLTPPRPEDAEILIAYARKQKALNLAASQFPMTLGSPDLRATYTASGLEKRMRALRPWVDARLELADGLVFRPRVASEPRTTDSALVLDCYLDSSYFADPATGEAWPGEQTGHRLAAVFAAMVRVDSRWIVSEDGPEELSCV